MPERFSADKIELINAKAKHYLFKNKLRSYLEGSAEVEEKVLSDHRACGLGKWITDIGKRKYSDFVEMEELDQLHQGIHTVAQEIIVLKKSEQFEVAKTKMDEINKIGTQIIAKIDALEKILENKINA